MYTILICDDDRDIVSALDIYLTSEGYKTIKTYNGKEALRAVEENPVHLILMDVMMPELDGIRATAKLREDSNVPIILLTAKSEDSDKILGLNIGADDYITKPFNPLEVMARVKSQLRRYTSLGGAEKVPGLLTVGPVSMDDSAKLVTVDGEPVSLTPIEYNILKLLMTHPGRVFSSAQIYEQVWNDPAYGSENTVAVHIRHLREKIEIDPADPRWLKVVWGLGYKMEKGADHEKLAAQPLGQGGHLDADDHLRVPVGPVRLQGPAGRAVHLGQQRRLAGERRLSVAVPEVEQQRGHLCGRPDRPGERQHQLCGAPAAGERPAGI